MKSGSRFGLTAVAMGLAMFSMDISASAQGLFDFLFRPQPHARSYAPAPPFGAPPSYGEPAVSAPRISGTGRYAAFCVRLCDGKFYPIQGSSTSQAVEACNSMCPTAENKIFSGTDISSAVSRDGARYSALPNAFAYREKTVDNCTCNGKDPYGLAQVDIEKDPTLRRGDLIATAEGLEKYNGPNRAVARASNRRTASDAGEFAPPAPRRTAPEPARREYRAPPPVFPSFFGR